MPEQYRHGKEAKVVEPKVQQIPIKSSIPQTTPPPLPPKVVPSHPLPVKKRFSSSTKAMLIAGALILLALIIVGYLLLRTSQPKIENQVQTTSETKPTAKPGQAPPGNTQEPTPTPEPEPAPIIESPFTNEVVPGKDSDSDGLTDVEETIIYKTNPNLPDSDLDGFLDGNEVFHLYNPSGKSPGTLLSAGFVSTTTIPPDIKLMYPLIWQTQSNENLSVSILSTTGEVIVVTVISQTQEALGQTILSWIDEQGGQENVVKTTTKTDKEFYMSQDKRSAIVIVGSNVLSFKYDVSTKTTIDYVQTFQMIINSLQ